MLLSLGSVQALGAAFLRKDVTTVVLLVVFVILATWSVLLLERQAALLAKRARLRGERRLRVLRNRPLPGRLGMRVLGRLVTVGLPLGLLLFVAMPRFDVEPRGPTSLLERTTTREDRRATPEGDTNAPTRNLVTLPSRFFTTPVGVESIKQRETPVFEVIDPRSIDLPPRVFLRDNALDHYDPTRVIEGRTHIWAGSPHLAEGSYSPLEPDANGWFALSPTPKPERRGRRTLRARILAGGFTRLYVQPWVVRARILRPRSGVTLPLRNVALLTTRLDAVQIVTRASIGRPFDAMETAPLQPGDIVEFESVPQSRDRAALVGQRSDASVSPDPAYLQVPELVHDELHALARRVVGDETDPWRRAERLVAWLRSRAFTYRLDSRPLDPRMPVVDFLTLAREGSCSHFAQSLTLLLRTLGHPARYTRGFWGGDPQRSRGSWVFRLRHYHAYTELWLEEYGWVALNPTPPDRIAVDAAGREYDTSLPAPLEDGEGPEDASLPPVENDRSAGGLLDFGRDQQEAFFDEVGATVTSWIEPVLATASRPMVRWPLGMAALLGLALLVRSHRRRAGRRALLEAGGAIPEGPYGEALVWLSAQGHPRRGTQTPREYLTALTRRVPEVHAPLAVLTTAFETSRYGAGASGGDEGRQALRALRGVRMPRSGRGT